MDTITVAITGINAVDNPGPGVGIARSLKEDKDLNVRIVGLAYDAMEPGIYMDWLVDRAYVMPYPSGGHECYFQRLAHIKHTYGLDVIIPCLDVELPLFSQYADELHAMGIRTMVPTSEQFRLRGKDKLVAVADRIGLKVPRTEVVTNMDAFLKATEAIGLPVMVKGAFYKALRAFTGAEAVAHYEAIVAEWGYPVIVQEMVRGEELNVVGVGDGKGGSLGTVGIKKLTTTALGKIWTGVTVKNDAMLTATERFLKEYQWQGPFELECMVDGDDVHLIEINPRFPAWSYFATGVGINLPSNMIRKALGLPLIYRGDYDSGKLFVRYTYELITDMSPFQEMVTKGEHHHAVRV